MIWTWLRTPNRYGAMRGFQRRVLWPKCTPASRSWRRETSGSAIGSSLSYKVPVLSSAGEAPKGTGPQGLRPERPPRVNLPAPCGQLVLSAPCGRLVFVRTMRTGPHMAQRPEKGKYRHNHNEYGGKMTETAPGGRLQTNEHGVISVQPFTLPLSAALSPMAAKRLAAAL